ncbi:major facilitator superfamily domain-containing protein 10-like isoform X2 [Homarus americanus]|uniref:major facilitator superfamily domain-containing protein 10-like isoform X2 n=1 Tax=Homarus americanus TaxID=6706 RepID=UPI001C47B4DA|nr:major facilitator superfamily domain-containing protein 10-like isoform X2 [Homarus americanus]
MVIMRSGTRTKKDTSQNATLEAESNGKTMSGSSETSLHSEKADSTSVSNKAPSKMQGIVFMSLILDLLGFTVILPLFPALLDYYSKHDTSGLYSTLLSWVATFQHLIGIPARFNSVLFGGLLGSLFSLLQFLASPITGALSDVYGRKPIYICTLIGVAASYGMWALASNFAVFVLARIIGGATKGNVSLAYSVMTDISDEKSRAKGMALIGVAFSIGFTIGPAVGAMFSRWGSTGWFAASAMYALALALCNIVYTYIFFKETLPETNRRKSVASGLSQAWELINPRSLFSFSPVKGLEKQERAKLVQLGRVYFLYLFLYSGLEFTLTFVTHHKHSYDSMAQGRMFSYLGLVMALMQGGYVRRVKDGSEKAMANKGLIMMIPAFILIGASETNWGLYTGLTLYALGSSMMVPCLTALASYHGAESHKGTLLGIWRSLGALARAVGPVVTSIGQYS